MPKPCEPGETEPSKAGTLTAIPSTILHLASFLSVQRIAKYSFVSCDPPPQLRPQLLHPPPTQLAEETFHTDVDEVLKSMTSPYYLLSPLAWMMIIIVQLYNILQVI